jgi:hypothetical protein
MGSKFRTNRPARLAVESFCNITGNLSAPAEWKAFVQEKFAEQMRRTHQDLRFPQVSLPQLFEKVKEHYVITPADKNPQCPVFWCPKFYSDQLLLHIDSDAFGTVTESAKAAADAIENDVRRYGFHCVRAFPYIYVLPKLHKLDLHRAKVRTIAGKSKKNVPEGEEVADESKSLLSPLSSFVANALNSCIDLLVMADRKNSVKRCWIIRDSQEFIDCYGQLPVTESLVTSDFTTMYTQLPHAELRAALAEAIEDVAVILSAKFACTLEEAKKNVIFASVARCAQWSFCENPPSKAWNLSRLLAACNTIIDRADGGQAETSVQRDFHGGRSLAGHQQSVPLREREAVRQSQGC